MNKFKPGDIVKLKNNATAAFFFTTGTENLEIKDMDTNNIYEVYKSDKSDFYYVCEHELEFQPQPTSIETKLTEKIKQLSKKADEVIKTATIKEASKRAKEENFLIQKFVSENCELIKTEDETIVKYINKEGTFLWAVEQLKQNKQVRRKFWGHPELAMFPSEHGTDIVWNTKGQEKVEFQLNFFTATDWEIYEENKFGHFKVGDDGNIRDMFDHIVGPYDFDNLEKAIKRARELQ